MALCLPLVLKMPQRFPSLLSLTQKVKMGQASAGSMHCIALSATVIKAGKIRTVGTAILGPMRIGQGTRQGRTMQARILACLGLPQCRCTFLSRQAVTSILKVASCISSRSIVSAFFRSMPSGSGFRSGRGRRTVRAHSQAGMLVQVPSSHKYTYPLVLGLFRLGRRGCSVYNHFPPSRGRAACVPFGSYRVPESFSHYFNSPSFASYPSVAVIGFYL